MYGNNECFLFLLLFEGANYLVQNVFSSAVTGFQSPYGNGRDIILWHNTASGLTIS